MHHNALVHITELVCLSSTMTLHYMHHNVGSRLLIPSLHRLHGRIVPKYHCPLIAVDKMCGAKNSILIPNTYTTQCSLCQESVNG